MQIIFHKRALKYRALSLEMTYKDKGSYESSPPCSSDGVVQKCMIFRRIVELCVCVCERERESKRERERERERDCDAFVMPL